MSQLAWQKLSLSMFVRRNVPACIAEVITLIVKLILQHEILNEVN